MALVFITGMYLTDMYVAGIYVTGINVLGMYIQRLDPHKGANELVFLKANFPLY